MLKVVPIASTLFNDPRVENYTDYKPHLASESVTSADELAEFAGRACYQSWSRPNPKTATSEGYLANILAQGHESVLEHASITFYVTGVSRSLTHELIRHRHLSFSELSQRYVEMAETEFVLPPALRESLRKTAPEGTSDEELNKHFQDQGFFGEVREAYADVIEGLAEVLPDLKRKQVREAARLVMPNATETKLVVTGNIRAWRDVLKKRYHVAADAEIREFATEILRHLREFAPNSVQDIPDLPYGSDVQVKVNEAFENLEAVQAGHIRPDLRLGVSDE